MNAYGVMRAPSLLLFGAGQRKALPAVVGRLGRRAFLCSDSRWTQDPMLTALAEDLRQAGIAVGIYDRTQPELPLECVLEAAAQAREFRPDVVVGVGGGSCLDMAKLVGLALSHPGPLSAYYGELKVPGPVLPVVAMPTTAGTGSEVTPVAVLADSERALKIGISSPYLIPTAAICDPELTLTCPPRLTAIAGADALTHAVEAFTAIRLVPSHDLATRQVFVGKNIFSDTQARIAIAALAANLEKAVAEPSDAGAREQVMLGALTAGIAFSAAGTAAAHAIQYPVGALTDTAHGLGVAALLPFVMEYNLPRCVPEYAEIGRLFGLASDGLSDEEFARRGIDAVDTLFQRIGVPRDLATLGLEADKQSWVATQSMMAARLVNNNPRRLDAQGMEQIVRAAFAGERARLR